MSDEQLARIEANANRLTIDERKKLRDEKQRRIPIETLRTDPTSLSRAQIEGMYRQQSTMPLEVRELLRAEIARRATYVRGPQ